MIAIEKRMDWKLRGGEMIAGPPLPHDLAGAVTFLDHAAIDPSAGEIVLGTAAENRAGKVARHRLHRAVEKMAVGQPLRVVVVERIGMLPHDAAARRYFHEQAAVPQRPGRIVVG